MDNELLSYLSRILDHIHYLKECPLSLKFSERDVRRTFFAKTANALRVYYLGHDFEFVLSKLRFEGSYLPKEIPHLENLGWIKNEMSNLKFLDTYHSILKLNLLNGSWVCFESCLDEIFKVTIQHDVIENMELRNYHRAAKLLSNLEIDKDRDEQLRTILRNRHIPINNKWNELFRLNYPDHRNIKEDRVFLEFFGLCRNCMHNNSISFRTAKFETKFGDFCFNEGIAIDFVTPHLILDMVRELAEIYLAFCNSISYEGEVIDPYSAQVELNDC